AYGFERARNVAAFERRKQGPSACAVSRAVGLSGTLPGAALRIDQSPQVVETISCDQACGHQLPQRGFDFCFEPGAAAHDIQEERRPARTQELEHLAPCRA